MYKELYHPKENLTDRETIAKAIWYGLTEAIKKAGKESILENPTVVDMGGGYAEFSKYLNKENIKCVSIDIQDLKINPGSNQIIADIYEMPITSESVDIINAYGSLDICLYEHNFPKLVEEISRVLKPGGIFSVIERFPAIQPEVWGKYFNLISEPGKLPLLLEKK